MKSREIPRENQSVATCMLTANLAQCTDRVAIRPVRFFKALSGVRRSIKSDTYLSFLRHPCWSQVHPPVVGPRCVTIARTPPPRARRS